MKLKRFLTTFIAGASLFTVSNTNPVFAGSCENAPEVGTVFKSTGPGTWKIMATVRAPLTSTNERRVAFGFKKLGLKAEAALASFVDRNVKNGQNLTEGDKAKFVVNENDEMTEDSLEGFEEFLDTYSSSTEALLVGLEEIGSCHTLGEEIRLTKGINSENAVAANDMRNQNYGGGSNTNNLNSPSNTIRRDLDKGYSGYGRLEDF